MQTILLLEDALHDQAFSSGDAKLLLSQPSSNPTAGNKMRSPESAKMLQIKHF